MRSLGPRCRWTLLATVEAEAGREAGWAAEGEGHAAHAVHTHAAHPEGGRRRAAVVVLVTRGGRLLAAALFEVVGGGLVLTAEAERRWLRGTDPEAPEVATKTRRRAALKVRTDTFIA